MPDRRDVDQLGPDLINYEAWQKADDFVAAMDRLHTNPGVTEAEVQEIATGILKLAEVSDDGR